MLENFPNNVGVVFINNRRYLTSIPFNSDSTLSYKEARLDDEWISSNERPSRLRFIDPAEHVFINSISVSDLPYEIETSLINYLIADISSIS